MSWLDFLDKSLDVGKVLAGATPIGAVISVVDAIVEETNTKVGVSDKDITDVLQSMAYSKWNNLDLEKVSRIAKIINEPAKEFDKAEVKEDGEIHLHYKD